MVMPADNKDEEEHPTWQVRAGFVVRHKSGLTLLLDGARSPKRGVREKIDNNMQQQEQQRQ